MTQHIYQIWHRPRGIGAGWRRAPGSVVASGPLSAIRQWCVGLERMCGELLIYPREEGTEAAPVSYDASEYYAEVIGKPEHPEPSPAGSRHGWWMERCDLCRVETVHMSAIGGECVSCRKRQEDSEEYQESRGMD